jgi:phosphoribosylamine--glycine ligase
MKNKVLVIGSGGREHALGWKLAQSDHVSDVLYAPGNAGTAKEKKGRNIPIDATQKENFPSIEVLIESESVDLTVVGPEVPLSKGLVDFLNSRGHDRIFGPTSDAARLESDKAFSCDVMGNLSIPQASSELVVGLEEGIESIKKHTTENGIVLKARGLTAGKGVMVCDTEEEAIEKLPHILAYDGHAIVAERLCGEEFSVFGVSDGVCVYPLLSSFQDHKALLDGDKGPNTGGMGAYGPAPVAPIHVVQDIADKILTPVVHWMRFEQGVPYKGFIYAGMMMTAGGPKVLEFNVRFGDPECQAAMMLLQGDLYEMISSALEGRCEFVHVGSVPGSACCVVLASQGYPGSYKKGLLIAGLEDAAEVGSVKIFHSGTVLVDDLIVTAGGRVLGVTACSAEGIADAQALAYDAASKISVEGGFHYRRDIAHRALKVRGV